MSTTLEMTLPQQGLIQLKNVRDNVKIIQYVGFGHGLSLSLVQVPLAF
jgi:hypothetical protein